MIGTQTLSYHFKGALLNWFQVDVSLKHYGYTFEGFVVRDFIIIICAGFYI